MPSVAALLSGGVDSAVALALFLEAHPNLKPHTTAYYLKIWLEDEMSFLGSCPWEEDIHFAEQVAQSLGVTLEIISLQREYYNTVVQYTIEELKKGGTPSPDIFCNRFIKFGVFLDRIPKADKIITGHYAQTIQKNDHTHLIRAIDPIKDQTYFLSRLDYEQITQLSFPTGGLLKQEVRNYARTHKLAPYERKDSQGICFLGKIKYKDFVKYYLGSSPGDIVCNTTGKKLGRHQGTWFYTIGQRSGLGLGGGPWYVVEKSLEDNIIWVDHIDMLDQKKLSVVELERVHWINHPRMLQDILQNTKDPMAKGRSIKIDDLSIKIRHGESLVPAYLQYNIEERNGMLHLAEGDAGISTGQYAVLYEQDECLGSARIVRGVE